MNDSSSAPSVRDPNTGACNSSGAFQSSDIMPLCARDTGGAAGTRPVSPTKAASSKESETRMQPRRPEKELNDTRVLAADIDRKDHDLG